MVLFCPSEWIRGTVKLVGHSSFDWGYYVLLFNFLPVSLCIVYLVSGLLVLFILSLHAILSQNGTTCHRHHWATHKRARQWRCRALPFSLIVRCWTCTRSCPPWLELHCVHLPTLMVDQSSSHVYPIYYLAQTDICLFSPQTYQQMHGGYSEVYGQSIQMMLSAPPSSRVWLTCQLFMTLSFWRRLNVD